MILLVVVTCWIGIAAVATVADVSEDDEEIESLTVPEGGNLTISIHIETRDEDPQVLVTHLKGSSQEQIAQMTCHNGDCRHEGWRSGVSLVSDGDNVTLIMMKVCYNQTGLYTVLKYSNKGSEKEVYNVTVYEPPVSTIIPEKTVSAKNSEFTAGISGVAVCAVLLVLALVVIISTVIYRKRRKANIDDEETQDTQSQSDHASYL